MLMKSHLKGFYKKPTFILIIILLAFFLKGVLLTVLFPIFEGQDEARHYNSIQFLNEPREKTWKIEKKLHDTYEKEYLFTYNFSEEIRETAKAIDIEPIRTSHHYDKLSFTEGSNGEDEEKIIAKKWEPYNKTDPPDVVSSSILYHRAALQIEKILSEESIFVRYFTVRIFSVLLGVITIFISYLLARSINFTSKQSLLFTAIISFQPKFSIYFSNINYDTLLIPAFFAFTLGGILVLKSGFNWKNTSLLVASLIVGIFTKGVTMLLFPIFLGLLFFQCQKHLKSKGNIALAIVGSIMLAWLVGIKNNIIEILSVSSDLSLFEITSSFINYFSGATLSVLSPAESYWGAMDWIHSDYSIFFIFVFWFSGIISTAGLTYFLYSKKRFDYLPEKKFIIFLIFMIVILQLGIRFFDWKQVVSGLESTVGTPGRYFLPNLASHIILVFVGIGALLRKESHFNYALKIGLALMFLFFMHLVLNTIIPQFYL